MQSFYLVLQAFQVLLALCLISLFLVQHGRGADAGAAFGSGASSTVFGSQGSTSFFVKLTAILAFLFLCNTLGLAFLTTRLSTPVTALKEAPTSIVEQILNEEESSQQTEQPLSIEGTPLVPNDTLDVDDSVIESQATDKVISELPDGALQKKTEDQ